MTRHVRAHSMVWVRPRAAELVGWSDSSKRQHCRLAMHLLLGGFHEARADLAGVMAALQEARKDQKAFPAQNSSVMKQFNSSASDAVAHDDL